MPACARPQNPDRIWRRLAVAFDRRLCADVLEAFSSSLLRQLRWRVKRELGLESVTDALPGAITFSWAPNPVSAPPSSLDP